ncbi:MAG: NUDIX hydrolase [Anaerolineae bacterium]
MKKWTVEESRVVLDASPFMIVKQERCHLPNGVIIPDYNVVSEPDIVVALVITPEQQIVLVEQYKHGIGEICLEVPGGLSDGGEPLAEIQREVREETGYESEHWELLSRYITNPTRFDNYIYAFIAHNAQRVGEQDLDDTESIRVHELSIPEVFAAVAEGRIASVHSIATIFQGFAQAPANGQVASAGNHPKNR